MENMIKNIPDMLTNHWFWGILTLVCLAWYSFVTVYVGIKGMDDILKMLKKLGSARQSEEGGE
jgi:hypothetical protein